MASASQGYEINLNLIEAEADSSILNVLGGEPIASDIRLFFNNKRNVSSIQITSSDLEDSFTVLLDGAVFTFTDKTEVTLVRDSTEANLGTYYIKESNNTDSFKLSTNSDLLDTVNISSLFSGSPTITIERSDEVTKENIENLSIEREPTVEDFSSSQIISPDTDTGTVPDSVNSSLIDLISRSTGLINDSGFSDFINDIDINIDVYNAKRDSSIKKTEAFETSRDSIFTGAVRIIDIDGLNDSSLSLTSNPGLFIADSDGNTKRAFSSNENLWEEIGSDLVVSDVTGIEVGALVFTGNNGIDVTEKGSAEIVELDTLDNIVVQSGDISGSVISFAPGTPVFVNGTKVTVNSKIFYVKNSTGETQFEISEDADLSTTVANPDTGTYTAVRDFFFTHYLEVEINGETYGLCMVED